MGTCAGTVAITMTTIKMSPLLIWNSLNIYQISLKTTCGRWSRLWIRPVLYSNSAPNFRFNLVEIELSLSCWASTLAWFYFFFLNLKPFFGDVWVFFLMKLTNSTNGWAISIVHHWICLPPLVVAASCSSSLCNLHPPKLYFSVRCSRSCDLARLCVSLLPVFVS